MRAPVAPSSRRPSRSLGAAHAVTVAALCLVSYVGCTEDPAATPTTHAGTGEVLDDGGGAIADTASTDTASTDTANTDTASTDTASPDTANTAQDSGGADAGADTAAIDSGPVDGAGCGACAANEQCAGDTCVVVPLPNAATLIGQANKITKLQILATTEGCDLDGDTGVDNAFGKLVGIYPAANASLQQAVKDHDFLALLAAPDYRTDGVGFAVSWLFGEVKTPVAAGCDGENPAGCLYLASKAGVTLSSGGQWSVTSVTQPITVGGGALQGVNLGPTSWTMPIAGMALPVKLLRMRWTATSHGTATWQGTTKGMLCGVLDKVTLQQAAKAAAAGGSGDGSVPTFDQPDGLSFAVAIETKAVKVVGWAD